MGETWTALTAPELVEAAVRRQEGVLLANGAFCAHTGKYTGRSPQDKYFVEYPGCPLPRERHRWLSEVQFENLLQRVQQQLRSHGSYVFHGAVNQHPQHRLAVRFETEFAWHNLFVQRLFLAADGTDEADFSVFGAPSVHADPARDGTRSDTFIAIHLQRRIVLIGGTEYAGELKKSIFTVMHHHLATRDLLPMHCSASVGRAGDVALFFGLSGTGKTTLSADPNRLLIGDDEHGWADDGIFNMENGCYAKCIDLSEEREPDIFQAIRFGAVLENVAFDYTRQPLYHDRTLTENTRAAYPLQFIRNIETTARGGHPRAIVFLSADASGVLPAVARLSPDDARRHYLLGYTSKLAGTERGVVHPEATFSACFAAPFLTDAPLRYANMLMQRIIRHRVPVYLLNTGWVGTGYGEGERIPLAITRELVTRIVAGDLSSVPTRPDADLFLEVPVSIDGIPNKYLQPELAAVDPASFRQRKQELAAAFARTLAGLAVATV